MKTLFYISKKSLVGGVLVVGLATVLTLQGVVSEAHASGHSQGRIILAQGTEPLGPADFTNPVKQGYSPTGFQLQNPLGTKNICQLLQALLRVALSLGIPVMVLFMVYAGFRFILARGNQEALTNAKKNMLYVVIGIALFLGAWVIGQIIAATLQQLGAGTSQSCSV